MKFFNNNSIKLFLAISILFATSCVNDNTKSQSNNSQDSSLTDTTNTIINQLNDIPYTAILDSANNTYKMVKNEINAPTVVDSLNVVEVMNRKYPEIKIEWEYSNKDTAFIKIPNSEYLTQESGTLGAEVFLAESTYAITEIPNINFVYFKFKIGDHALPGLYRKTDFPKAKNPK